MALLGYSYPKFIPNTTKHMTWRVHLSNQAIANLDILYGKVPLLAAWVQRDRAAFFELETGAPVGEQTYRAQGFDNRRGEKWQEYLGTLVAPNGAHLPCVRTAQAVIYTTEDGKTRLYQIGDLDLLLDLNGSETRLDTGKATAFTAVAFDRVMGVTAALDEKRRLHLYQQPIYVGAFDLKLTAVDEGRSLVAIANGGAAIFVASGQELVLTDTGGKVRKRAEMHYSIGRLACSPDGKLVVTCDLDSGVIRAYDGPDLTPTHQRHAIDLLEKATQVQLIAEMPPVNVAPGSLVVDDRGTLAFPMSGVVCVTSIKRMDALPRPQPLL
jgi:hypothetical protein